LTLTVIESVNVKSHDQIVAELLGRPGVRAEVDRMERAPDSSSKPANLLPQYEADEGALTKAQLSQIKKSAPKAKGGTVRSSLFEMESA